MASKHLNESGCSAKIIFSTVHAEADFVQTCLATGAFAYVAKTRFATDLIPAIYEALAGQVFISRTFSYQLSM